jgi:hypothetical protein
MILPALRFAHRSLYAGFLQGDVKIAGDPEAPLRRAVVLFAEPNASAGYPGARHYVGLSLQGMRFSRTTDGAFAFQNLNPALTYTVIAWDSAGVYDPVIKAGLTPE